MPSRPFHGTVEFIRMTAKPIVLSSQSSMSSSTTGSLGEGAQWDRPSGLVCKVPVKNTAQIVVQCSGRNTQCYNKITTCTNSSYVKVIMSLMKDKSSMKYSLQCSGRNTEAESETNC